MALERSAELQKSLKLEERNTPSVVYTIEGVYCLFDFLF